MNENDAEMWTEQVVMDVVYSPTFGNHILMIGVGEDVHMALDSASLYTFIEKLIEAGYAINQRNAEMN